MTDRERAIKYRKEARRYKRKYGKLIRAVENIRAEIEQLKDSITEEIRDYGLTDMIEFVNGINACMYFIEKHTEGNDEID